MKTIQAIGKNVDEAIASGLKELGLLKEEVNIEVLDEGSKGVLGLFGTRLARVRITEKYSAAGDAVEFITNIAKYLGVNDPGIAVAEKGDTLRIMVDGQGVGAMIGHRGETLDALQLLTGLKVNHMCADDEEAEYHHISLDVGGYRKKREETLRKLALRLADKVRATGRNVALEPMNSYERRIIHATLHDETDVLTFSEGKDPRRRVVISPKQQ